jgi:hypothetical protein
MSPQSGGEPRVTVDQGIGTPVTASANQAASANAAAVATLGAVAAKTNYLTALILTAGVAAANVNLACTITGLITGTWTLILPAGTAEGGVIDVSFVAPIPASAANTAIVATIPASGATGPPIAVVVAGYYL